MFKCSAFLKSNNFIEKFLRTGYFKAEASKFKFFLSQAILDIITFDSLMHNFLKCSETL